MTTRERLHELVEALPGGELAEVERLLRSRCEGAHRPAAPPHRSSARTGEAKPRQRFQIRNPALLASIEQAQREVREGKGKRFATVDEAIDWLHNGPAPESETL